MKRPDRCLIRSCKNDDVVGAHVQKYGKDSRLYILPICRKHNHPSNVDWMDTDYGKYLVKIDREAAGDDEKCYKRKR